ncbi:hypothetical protein BC628DRAFT_274345 [Trametes gibbosa]|nr:hypothetical protein BC628DRAFT_274345 [Trametes gibbosa]
MASPPGRRAGPCTYVSGVLIIVIQRNATCTRARRACPRTVHPLEPHIPSGLWRPRARRPRYVLANFPPPPPTHARQVLNISATDHGSESYRARSSSSAGHTDTTHSLGYPMAIDTDNAPRGSCTRALVLHGPFPGLVGKAVLPRTRRESAQRPRTLIPPPSATCHTDLSRILPRSCVVIVCYSSRDTTPTAATTTTST